MKNKGFTLIEILAAIVILSVIMTIAVASYSSVQKSALENQLANKIEFIEIAAERYAQTENILYNQIINVKFLIENGYLSSENNDLDEMGNIILKYNNPVTNESLLCNTINLYRENDFQAVFNTDDVSCELSLPELGEFSYNVYLEYQGFFVETFNSEKGAVVPEYDSVTGETIQAYDSSVREMPFASKDVYIYLNNVEAGYEKITYNFEGGSVTTKNSGSFLSGEVSSLNNSYDNVFHLSKDDYLYLNSVLEVNIYYPDKLVSGLMRVKIDNEVPTSWAEVEDPLVWDDFEKQIEYFGDDNNGSGLKMLFLSDRIIDDGYIEYVDYEDFQYDESGFYSARNNDIFYAYAMDIAGNLSEPFEVVIDRMDTTDPVVEESDINYTLNDNFKYDISILATDLESGIASYALGSSSSINCSNQWHYTDVDQVSSSYTITMNDVTSTYLELCVKDAAGNYMSDYISLSSDTSYDVNYEATYLNNDVLTTDYTGNLVFVIDRSSNYHSSYLRTMIAEIMQFLNSLDNINDINISVLSYSNTATVNLVNSNDLTEIETALNSITISSSPMHKPIINLLNDQYNVISNNGLESNNDIVWISSGKFNDTLYTDTLIYDEFHSNYNVHMVAFVSSIQDDKFLTLVENDTFYKESVLYYLNDNVLSAIYNVGASSYTYNYTGTFDNINGALLLQPLISTDYHLIIEYNNTVLKTITSTTGMAQISSGKTYYNYYLNLISVLQDNNIPASELSKVEIKYYTYEENT